MRQQLHHLGVQLRCTGARDLFYHTIGLEVEKGSSLQLARLSRSVARTRLAGSPAPSAWDSRTTNCRSPRPTAAKPNDYGSSHIREGALGGSVQRESNSADACLASLVSTLRLPGRLSFLSACILLTATVTDHDFGADSRGHGAGASAACRRCRLRAARRRRLSLNGRPGIPQLAMDWQGRFQVVRPHQSDVL